MEAFSTFRFCDAASAQDSMINYDPDLLDGRRERNKLNALLRLESSLYLATFIVHTLNQVGRRAETFEHFK